MNIDIAFVVILVTAALSFWLGWMLNRGAARLDRTMLLDKIEQATANVQPLPRAGYLPGPSFAGRSVAGQPDPMVAFDAGYELGLSRAGQDDVSREVAAIFAEVDADPERWQR